MNKLYLTATDLMKYLYDPRIIYFMYVLKIPQGDTPKRLEGISKYEKFKISSKRNKIIKELPYLRKLYDIYLASSTYQLATRIDCVAIDDSKREAYPIQIKYSKKPKILYRTQKFQVVMEGLLIEDCLKFNVPYGYIKFLNSNDFIKVAINSRLKKELFKIFSEIRDIIEKEKFPKATKYKKRNTDNVYKNIL